MPRKSSIDKHPERAAIERAIALGWPIDRVAKKFGISRDCVWRHRKRLPAPLKAAMLAATLKPGEDLEKLRTEESEGLLANLAAQRARLLLAQDEAASACQWGLVSQLAGGIHANLRLVAQYLGELQHHSTHTSVSILISSEYLQFRSALQEALRPFPEAARAVAAVLHQTEQAAASQISNPPKLIEAQPVAEASTCAP